MHVSDYLWVYRDACKRDACNASVRKNQNFVQMGCTKKMKLKYQNKYNAGSSRLQHYDYGSNGAYFITICTQDRENFFGKIVNETMLLSKEGKIIKQEWRKTPKMRKNVVLGEWIIMPNHFHAIINVDNGRDVLKNRRMQKDGKHMRHMQCVSTGNAFGPQRNNLASIIRGFKGSCTKKIREQGNLKFRWQPKFYDRIIRNENELKKITDYIKNNPKNWKEDSLFLHI